MLEPNVHCCKIVILELKHEYVSYRHLSWRILFLKASNS